MRPLPSPAAPSAGAAETRGLEPVPDEERTGRVRGLFPTWVAANVTVLLVTIGAGLTAVEGLTLWQVSVAAVASPVVSYGLVGLASLAGRRGGCPGMALSRASFGQRGNLLPGVLIWVARWGWETINAVTGAYALLTVAALLLGAHRGALLDTALLLAFVAATFLLSGLGIRALRVCATWCAYLFAAFSVAVVVHLAGHTDWPAVLGRPAAPAGAVLAGIGTLAAGGISWAPTGADFTRYLPRTASARAVVAVTVGGALVVVVPLVLIGAVMAAGSPGLATAHDPVAFVGHLLPAPIAVPYLLTVPAGMLLINAMSMYSAGFTAQTLGIRLPRVAAVSVNAVISVVLGLLLMLVATSFFGAFQSFLALLGVAFSAWIGVFGTDMLRGRTYDPEGLPARGPGGRYWYRHGFAVSAVVSWGAALAVGLLFTRVAWFTGPLASTWVGRDGLGWAATAATAALLLMALPRDREDAPRSPAAPGPAGTTAARRARTGGRASRRTDGRARRREPARVGPERTPGRQRATGVTTGG